MKPFTFTLPHTPMIYLVFEDKNEIKHLAYWEPANSRLIYLDLVSPEDLQRFEKTKLSDEITAEIIDKSTGIRDNYITI